MVNYGINACLVSIRYFLPDYYSAARVTISLRKTKDGEWMRIFSGVLKPISANLSEMPYFLTEHLIETDEYPEDIKIEVSGYGSMGITYAELWQNGECFAPKRIVATEGLVRKEETILVPDTFSATLGYECAHELLHQPEKAAEHHVVVIGF